ncbi:ribonuclease R [Ignavibacteria bacterium 4148-Me]|uniref:ribonuclease R n=1 Tax=Rosettibacter primus TaxID=3111523 RepID=UPI00336BE355
MKKKIKSFFKNNPSLKIKSKELAERLSIFDSYEYAELKYYLHKLTEEGFLEKSGKRYQLNRYGSEKLIGTLQIISDGDYGFVILNNQNIKDVFIAGKNLNTAFDGDIVEVKLLERQRGKNIEGTIVDIVERNRKEIVGTLQKSNSFYFVIPDDKKIHRDIYISSKNLGSAKAGDKVVVGNIKWISPNLNPEGKIIEVLGKAGSFDVEIASIAREFELPYKFPNSVLKEAEKITEEIPEAEFKKRIDLRDKIIFTIDPEDAKDFDDAVSVEILKNGNFLLGVHIADVSHYVRENSATYKEALKRGTSVYLVGKVIPMLPEKLSNQICSLVPGKDRLTFSVLAEVTPTGKIVNYEIHKSIINSKRRFTYEEVQKIIDEGQGDFYEQIALLNKIAKVLREKRIKKGSINFFTPEVVFKLDKNGKPVEINIKKVGESNNLIEELMLMANQIIATHVQPKKGEEVYPFVYRVHDQPDKEKIIEFARFVRSLGYSFDPNSSNKSKEFQKLLDSVKGTEEEAVVNEIAIRSMAKAIYSTKNIGHYGLGFKYYTHFTSPIRRFPDLIVHNLIYNYLQNKLEKKYNIEDLEKICEHASERERTAINAERLSVKLKQIEYLKSKVGQEFHGVVSGITNFGIFVELSQNLAEGLIRYRDMDDDYYLFDEKNYSITGKSTGRRIRLGDKVNVKLIRVDEEKREIDFKLIN